jgi:Zn-finger nucleic acid-binding protein
MMETIMEKTEALGMLCPHCRVDLVMSERQGVEIDYCPKCRGIWLDRGELDKIVERALGEARAAAPVAPASFLPRTEAAQGLWPSQSSREEASYERARGYREDSDDQHRDGRHRRESFLERLFD